MILPLAATVTICIAVARDKNVDHLFRKKRFIFSTRLPVRLRGRSRQHTFDASFSKIQGSLDKSIQHSRRRVEGLLPLPGERMQIVDCVHALDDARICDPSNTSCGGAFILIERSQQRNNNRTCGSLS
jgi:hypothetical protein